MKKLVTITSTPDSFQIEPLQHYVGMLAKTCNISDNRVYQIEMLVEELFTQVQNKISQNHNAEIELTISHEESYFFLSLTFPLIQNILSHEEKETDKLSLSIIKQLSASYKADYCGENKYQIEISIKI